jgi:hypothetical protein
MCLNFIEGGKCHVNGRDCILGPLGATARNEDHDCQLHGGFDLWITQGRLLITDMGFPPEEPVQSIALGVNETVAMQVGEEKSLQLGISLTTSQRRCAQCGTFYWVSRHTRTSGLAHRGSVTFCPDCLSRFDYSVVESKLGENRHWCG